MLNEKAKYTEVTKEQQSKIDLIRSTFEKVYDVIECNHLQLNRESDIAIQKLEEAQMWLIKGITRS